jgi:hypothetical protein
MGNICNKLYTLLKCSKNSDHLDLDFNNYNNNRINNNRTKNVLTKNVLTKNVLTKNVLTKNVPNLDISNAIININNTEDEPPSYREVREGTANFYKKTMLFNGFSDTLIGR